jgi:ribosomal protein S18 acetylase RimI-like enzyme
VLDIEDATKRLARIHYTSLNEGVLSLLGIKYLEVFYGFIDKSGSEDLLLKKEGNKIVGLCVISYAPNSILTRALLATWMDFCRAFVPRFLVNSDFRKVVFDIVFSKKSLAHRSPEIAYIATSEHSHGKGHGSELLCDVFQHLRSRGYKELYVKTLSSEENRALNFYKKHEFNVIQNTIYAGLSYAFLRRDLTD